MQNILTDEQEEKAFWMGDIIMEAAERGLDLEIFVPGFFSSKFHEQYQRINSGWDTHGEAYLCSVANEEVQAPLGKTYSRNDELYSHQLGEALQLVIYDLGVTGADIFAKRSFSEWFRRLNDPYRDAEQYANKIEQDFGFPYDPV